MQDQAQRNMAMFSDAMKVFNPFAAVTGTPVPGAPAPGKPQAPGSSKDDLQALKDQLAAMQQKIDTLANK
jgi:polyhydroxyalkanoate synthesis regulator protein